MLSRNTIYVLYQAPRQLWLQRHSSFVPHISLSEPISPSMEASRDAVAALPKALLSYRI